MLNQVWHIFRKDVRHQWIEIVLSLALLMGFVWAKMGEWSRPATEATGVGGVVAIYFILGVLAVPLLPISWMFLIARAVHDESLAGDRQFWVTRPYDWKQLLAAKILFVIAFVNVPLFFAHIFLVYEAGFHPTQYLAGLLWLQLFWMLILLLPTAALAAVTRNIVQMLLAVLFVGLFTIALSILSAVVPSSSFSAPRDSIDVFLVIIAAIAVVLLQYSLRRTTQSRWIIAGLAAALALAMVAAPYRTLIARAYPPASADFPPQLTIAGTLTEVHYQQRNRVPLPITLKLSGLPQDSFLQLNGYMLNLKNATGRHWDSGWTANGAMFFPDAQLVTADVSISKEEIDNLSSSPITGDLFLAFTFYRDRNPRPFVVPPGEFLFPDLGFCTSDPNNSIGSLSCRIALRRPTFLEVSSEMATSTCPLPKDQLPPKPGEVARAFVRGGSDLAEPGLSPIMVEGISVSEASNNRISGICPGTPLTLNDPEEASHRSVEIHIDNSWFDAYLRALNHSRSQ